jgi:alpha-amylase/alpha-mannosidase (GH57 family)
MRYVCIHCHFYQPPRENPWLEAIELQDSAYPYHDWNERITAESYAPNAFSRILDGTGKIAKIINNYSRISFNVGPTLLSWMEDKSPELYQAVLDADHESAESFSGHGSAIAQAYNHMIMPLANLRDKWTQVAWGIADFKRRFKRPPEGMWLPETAVDNESLDIMAQQGIKFTILAPYQCRRVRKIGGGARWREVPGGGIDPSRAYRVRLMAGRHIDVFFYDGPISRAVAFEGLLGNGEHFAGRLLSASSESRDWPELLHIATDGETYGHHHRYGEMALTYALQHLEEQDLAKLTNYGEYLALYPPTHEVEIYENTAWSCAHGVERWNSDCGCNSGRQGWNQAWRNPLRQALNWLRDRVSPLFEKKAGELV